MVKHTRGSGVRKACFPAGGRVLGALGVLTVLVVAAGAGACSHPDDGLTQQLLAANDKVLACQKELAQTKDQVAGLKRQVAQAMANPSRVQLKDPEVSELVASIRTASAAAGDDAQSPAVLQKAGEVFVQGKQAMQSCYERALKRNAALQTQSGIGFKLGVTIKPTGAVEGVEVEPSYDQDMTACIRSVARHWKFPTFQGKAFTIEQPVTLTPKT